MMHCIAFCCIKLGIHPTNTACYFILVANKRTIGLVIHSKSRFCGSTTPSKGKSRRGAFMATAALAMGMRVTVAREGMDRTRWLRLL